MVCFLSLLLSDNGYCLSTKKDNLTDHTIDHNLCHSRFYGFAPVVYQPHAKRATMRERQQIEQLAEVVPGDLEIIVKL